MCFPAAIAFLTLAARSLVVCESKYIKLFGSARASSRLVVHLSRPKRAANFSNLSGLRPTRTGLGMINSSSLILTPPCFIIARIERMRCWFVPIRPVTPLRMIPISCVLRLAICFVSCFRAFVLECCRALALPFYCSIAPLFYCSFSPPCVEVGLLPAKEAHRHLLEAVFLPIPGANGPHHQLARSSKSFSAVDRQR